MRAFSILLLLAIEQEILTAPLQPFNREFFEIIEKKCPSFTANKQFADQKIFQNCKNWKEINETTHLRENNTNNVLCLLYYDTFIPFCTSIEKAKSRIHNVTLNLTEDLKNYTPSTICKNLALFPANKTFEHNITEILKTESICFKLCTKFDDTPVDYCSMAYYFANYNISSLDQISKTPETAVTNQKPTVPATGAGNDTVTNNAITPKPVLVTNKITDGARTAENNDQKEKEANHKSINDDNIKRNEQILSEIKPDNEQISKLIEKNDQKDKEANQKNTQDALKISNDNIERNKQLLGHESEPDKHPDNGQQTPVPTEKNQSLSNPIGKKEKLVDVLSVGDNEKEDNENKAAAVETEKPVKNHAAEKEAPSIDKKKDEEAVKKHIAEEDVEETPLVNLDGEQGTDDFDEDEGEHGEAPDAQSEPVQEPILQNSGTEEKNEKPINTVAETPVNFNTIEEIDGESNFFNYFMVICLLFVLGYVGYHNRQKVLALVLEGKRGKRQYRGRRPNSANYHKLDSNLEEAISSSCSKNSSNIIY